MCTKNTNAQFGEHLDFFIPNYSVKKCEIFKKFGKMLKLGSQYCNCLERETFVLKMKIYTLKNVNLIQIKKIFLF